MEHTFFLPALLGTPSPSPHTLYISCHYLLSLPRQTFLGRGLASSDCLRLETFVAGLRTHALPVIPWLLTHAHALFLPLPLPTQTGQWDSSSDPGSVLQETPTLSTYLLGLLSSTCTHLPNTPFPTWLLIHGPSTHTHTQHTHRALYSLIPLFFSLFVPSVCLLLPLPLCPVS